MGGSLNVLFTWSFVLTSRMKYQSYLPNNLTILSFFSKIFFCFSLSQDLFFFFLFVSLDSVFYRQRLVRPFRPPFICQLTGSQKVGGSSLQFHLICQYPKVFLLNQSVNPEKRKVKVLVTQSCQRRICPWNSPAKTRVGSHPLPQETFLTQRGNPVLLHCKKNFLNHLSH